VVRRQRLATRRCNDRLWRWRALLLDDELAGDLLMAQDFAIFVAALAAIVGTISFPLIVWYVYTVINGDTDRGTHH
jgi:hypothetical protein